MTRLNRSRIKYTPGLCGTSCTFFWRSGFSFFDAGTRLQNTREGRNGKQLQGRRAAPTGPAARRPYQKRQGRGLPALPNCKKKAPAKFSRALTVPTWKTTL